MAQLADAQARVNVFVTADPGEDLSLGLVTGKNTGCQACQCEWVSVGAYCRSVGLLADAQTRVMRGAASGIFFVGGGWLSTMHSGRVFWR